LSLDDFRLSMYNVTCHANKDNLDEAPLAYKNINEVLAAQEDLFTIGQHLKPIINVKG